jgi:hypothetical protein
MRFNLPFATPYRFAVIPFMVLSFVVAACTYTGGERTRHDLTTPDGIHITCFEPPPEVIKKASLTTDLDASENEIGALAKASVRGEVSPERIREKLPTNIAAFEVIEFRLCMAHANGLYSAQEYRAFLEARSGLQPMKEDKRLQLVIRKFETLPLQEEKPILVNVVINNLTSTEISVKGYDVTALLDSLADAREEMRREEELFNTLQKAMKEVNAISTDIPPYPPSSYTTLIGPVLPREGREKLRAGKLTFYVLGALVHPGGTTFYCSHTQGDGVFRLCRKHNSPS